MEKTVSEMLVKSHTPPTLKKRLWTGGLSLVAALVIIVGGGYLGYSAAAAQLGDTVDPLVKLQTSVASIDEDRSEQAFAGVKVGDTITVNLRLSELQRLLENALTETVCTPDGLTVNVLVDQNNPTTTKCGPSVHVVLVRPR